MAEWWEQDKPDSQEWWNQDALLLEDTGQSVASSMGSAFARGVSSVPSGVVGGAGALLSIVPGMEDNSLQRAGASMDEFTNRTFPINPIYSENPAVELSGVLGQASAQLATLPVGGLAGKVVAGARGLEGAAAASQIASAAQAGALGTGFLMGADAGEQTANRLGIESRARRAAQIIGSGSVEFLTERLGGFGTKEFTQGLLGQVPGFLRGSAASQLGRTALSEGGEEAIAGIAQPLLERAATLGSETTGEFTEIPFTTVEATRDLVKQALYGGVAGGFMGGVNLLMNRPDAQEAMGFKLRANARIQELEKAPSLTPQEQVELDELRTHDENATQWLAANAGLSPEQSREAVIAALTPPTEAEQATIQTIASDPVVVETEQIATQVETVAPATAEALRESVEPAITQTESQIVDSTLINETLLNESEQKESQVNIESGQEFNSQIAAPIQAEQSFNESLLQGDGFPASERGEGESDIARLSETTQRADTTPPSEDAGEVVQAATIQESPRVEAIASTIIGSEAASRPSESDPTSPETITIDETTQDTRTVAGSQTSGTQESTEVLQQPTGGSGESISFEQALRSEVSSLPAWTEQRIQSVLEWDKGGRQGAPPFGRPVVNRAILASDESARRIQEESERAQLQRDRELRRKYGTDEDIDDVQAKARIARQESDLAEIPSIELSFSAPKSSGPNTGKVNRSHAIEALERLNKTELGKRLADTAIIVDTIDDVQPALGSDPLPERAIPFISDVEGFFRPKTGQSVVILDNIGLYPDETPVEGVVRVILHERAFHGGFNWMYRNDTIFRMRANALLKDIPQSQADAVSEKYPELDRDSVGFLQEWAAWLYDSTDPNELAQRDPLFKRLWEMLKDLVSRVLGKPRTSKQVDRETRDLLAQILNKQQAFGNQATPYQNADILPEDVTTSLNASRAASQPYSQRAAQESIEDVERGNDLPENTSPEAVQLHQAFGRTTDKAYLVQRTRPIIDFVKSQMWTGGVDQEGNPIVNPENTLAFERENDRMTSNPNWGARWVESFRESASRSTDPTVRNNQGDVTAGVVQMEMANYALRMAVEGSPNAREAVEAVRRGRYANDIVLNEYATISTGARQLQLRSAATRGGLGFWKGIELIDDAATHAVNNTFGPRVVKALDDALTTPPESDISTTGIDPLPSIDTPTPPRITPQVEDTISDWRSALEQDGSQRIADAFMGLFEQPSADEQGPLLQANDDLNKSLTQILNETTRELGLIPERTGETPEQRRQRIIIELGLNDLRTGKILEIDQAVKERLAGISVDDPVRAEALFRHWEQISSAMRDRSISGATSRRVIYDVLNERKSTTGNTSPVSIKQIAALPTVRRNAEVEAIINKVVNDLRDTSRMTAPDGSTTTISEQDLALAADALRQTMDYLIADARATLAKAALARQERLAAEQAKKPTKEAQAIIDRIDESRTEWVGNTQNKSKVRSLKEEAIASQLTDSTRPGFLNRDGFIRRYAQGFQSLGVEPVAANALASRLYDENIRLRSNQNIREMDAKVKRGGIKGLIQELLENPMNLLGDPAGMKSAMVDWLRNAGLTEEQATRYANRHAPVFREKMVEAREKALQKALKGLRGVNGATVDKIRQAIRQATFNPQQGVSSLLAESLGVEQLTDKEIQELARIDMRMRDAGPSQYQAELGKMLEILQRKAPTMTNLNRTTTSWIMSVLSGLSTMSLGVFVPMNAAMGRLAFSIGELLKGGATGSISKADMPTAIYDTISDFIDGYKNYISAFKATWKNDVAVTHYDQTMNQLTSLREDMRRQIEIYKKGSPLEKATAAFKIAQDSTYIVRSIMNAADGASSMIFRHVFTRQETRRKLLQGENPMTAAEVGVVFQQAEDAGQRASEDAQNRLGYDQDASKQIGFDAANEYIYDYVSNRFSAAEASDIRDFAERESKYELGFNKREEGSGWDVFNLLAGLVQTGSQWLSSRNPLLARQIMGFTSIPVNLANRSLSYTPYGLLRLYWKNRDLEKNLDSKLYEQSMGNELQRRQRKIEGVAGTVGMLVLAALALAGGDDEDYTGLRVTGAGPLDQARRDAWLKQGWKPNSLTWVVNGKPVAAYAYARGGMEALKLPFLAVGAIDDLRLEGKLENTNALDAAADWVKASGSAGLQATRFFGLANIANLVGMGSSRASESSSAGNIAWSMSGFVPWSGLIKGATRPITGQLDQSSAQAAILAQIPIVSAVGGMKAMNFLGDEKGITPVDLFTKNSDRAYLNGFPLFLNIQKDSDTSRLYELFIRKGAAPSTPSRARFTSDRGNVSDEAWSRYVKTRGDILKKLVSRRYRQLNAMSRSEFADEMAAISARATREAKKALRMR